MVDVYRVQAPWSLVFEPVRDAGRAKHDLTGSCVENCISNEKAGPTLGHDKHLVMQ